MLALKLLSTQAMIAYGRALLDPGQLRPLLEAHPTTSAMIDKVAAVMAVLDDVSASLQIPELEAVATIRAELQRVDAQHDRKARGTFLVLSGLAELEDDDAVSDEYLKLRKLLFPRDLGFVNLSYHEEAGNAEGVQEVLAKDPSLAPLLTEIQLPHGRSAWTGVQEWIEAGKLLGKLELERVGLEQRASERTGMPSPSDVAAARSSWVRVIRALLGNVELEDFTSLDRARLLAPLEQALGESPDSR